MMMFIPSQYRNRKSGIIFTVIMLGLIACGFFLFSVYCNMETRFAEQEQQLLLNQKSIASLRNLRSEVRQQKQQIGYFERALFKGKAQDLIISTMQIQVQSMLSASGLEPELLRPVVSRETGGMIQSVVLKLRLSGTIEQFKSFLTTLYQAYPFFHIEGLTIRAFRDGQLKIYMDLRGYYQVAKDVSSTPKRGE